jgi:hypothetical protein
MRKEFKTLICLFMAAFSVISVGFSQNSGKPTSDAYAKSYLYRPQKLKQSDVEVRGTPFIFDDWRQGVLRFSDTTIQQPVYRYKLNVEDNEIWVLTEKNQELVFADPRILGVSLLHTDRMHTFLKLPIPQLDNQICFVEALHRGKKFALIKHVSKVYVKADFVNKGVAVVGKDYDSFEVKTAFYVINSDKAFIQVKLKVNDILKSTSAISSKYSAEITQFCKENDLKGNLSDEEAGKLVGFIEGFLSEK